MKRPAVFIDRDGTVNDQRGYINHLSRFVILPGVADALKLLNENGFLAVILTNQSGVARGYFPLELVHQVHAHMEACLREQGAVVDGVFFCPHYRQGHVPEYTVDCTCRKPRTGLIDQALAAFEIDMARSYVVGDMHTDMELAHNAGLKGVMVKTGYGLGEIEYILPSRTVKPAHIAEDLLDAVRWILTRERGLQNP